MVGLWSRFSEVNQFSLNALLTAINIKNENHINVNKKKRTNLRKSAWKTFTKLRCLQSDIMRKSLKISLFRLFLDTLIGHDEIIFFVNWTWSSWLLSISNGEYLVDWPAAQLFKFYVVQSGVSRNFQIFVIQ